MYVGMRIESKDGVNRLNSHKCNTTCKLFVASTTNKCPGGFRGTTLNHDIIRLLTPNSPLKLIPQHSIPKQGIEEKSDDNETIKTNAGTTYQNTTIKISSHETNNITKNNVIMVVVLGAGRHYWEIDRRNDKYMAQSLFPEAVKRFDLNGLS